MVGLDLRIFPSGPLAANNYLIFSRERKKAFVVDFSASSGELFQFIKKENISLEFIALTHAHFDHICGLGKTGLSFYLHRKDEELLFDPEKNGSYFCSGPLEVNKKPVYYSDFFYFQGNKVEVIETPGHTPGSVSLRLGKWLFTGDTLFNQSVGRTDIPLASGDVLLQSIKQKILTLPEDTLVYPGHGPDSTIAYEKNNNPFLKG